MQREPQLVALAERLREQLRAQARLVCDGERDARLLQQQLLAAQQENIVLRQLAGLQDLELPLELQA